MLGIILDLPIVVLIEHNQRSAGQSMDDEVIDTYIYFHRESKRDSSNVDSGNVCNIDRQNLS